jgi:hypothetical protein
MFFKRNPSLSPLLGLPREEQDLVKVATLITLRWFRLRLKKSFPKLHRRQSE